MPPPPYPSPPHPTLRTPPTAERAPIAAAALCFPMESNPVRRGGPLRVTHSPSGPSRRAPHLQLRAHVPAAPGPEPRAWVVPAAARPSVSAPPKPSPCSPQGRSGPHARGSAWGPRSAALAGTGTRGAGPALIPGSRGAVGKGGSSSLEVPGRTPPPGGRLTCGGRAVGRRLRGAAPRCRCRRCRRSSCPEPWASPAARSQFWPRLGAPGAGLGLVSRSRVLRRLRGACSAPSS